MELCPQIVQECVGHRRNQQGQQQTKQLPSNDDHRRSPALLGPGTRAERQRNHPGHQRESRHQNRTQSIAVCLEHSRQPLHTLSAEGVHVIDLQDRVLLHHTEQYEHSERRIEVDRLAHAPEREQREWNRERKREQNCKWMRETLELRRENDVHQHHRKKKRPNKLAKSCLQFTGAA